MRALLMAILAVTSVAATACDEHAVPDAPSTPASGSNVGAASSAGGAGPSIHSEGEPAPAERRDVRLSANVWDGVCLAHSWQNEGRAGYGTDESAATLDHLQTLGVGWLSLTPFAWMSSQQAASIRGEHNDAIPDAAESEERMRGVVEQARARDMKLVLKPHIWIRGGAYRGDIEPRGPDDELAWSTWWDSYDQFILYYAKMARDLEIPVLFVGVELESAINADPDRFLETIKKVRKVYDGRLIYGANWDEEQPERVWRALDHVGVQFYAPLTEAKNPTTEAIAEGIRRQLQPWRDLSRKTDRTLVIGEVGFRAAPDAAEVPHHWPERADGDGRTVDKDVQRRAYTALFSELARVDELRGVFVWKYFTDADTDERHDFGFSPRGYPAEAVLKRAYSAEPDPAARRP